LRENHFPFSTSAYQQISISANQHISISANQHISTSAHQHISISAHQHISISAHQHISTSAYQHISIMVFIASQKIEKQALRKLEKLGEVILFMTKGVTYPAIAGHPDIFFCRTDRGLIASRAVPENVLIQLEDAGIELALSAGIPEASYPGSALFNAVVTDGYLVHRTDITDIIIKNQCLEKQHINVNQAYTRCNLLVPDERLFITSDAGILKALKKAGLHTLYINPETILLEGFRHGFFGGCCGIWRDKVLVHGSLKQLQEGKEIRNMLEKIHFEVIELFDNPLTDIGSILSV
jgi:hypothetical protein